MGATAHGGRPRRHGHSAPRGQFFTPAPLARFLWQVTELFAGSPPRDGWRVVDPAAGEGVLLDEGCAGGWTDSRRAVGVEIDPGLAVARPLDAAPIHLGDGLLDRPNGVVDGAFDVAVANPPFGRARELLSAAQQLRLLAAPGAPLGIWGLHLQQGGQRTHEDGGRRVEELFLERLLQLVAHGGIVACIVPDSPLANRREQRARDWVGQRACLLAAAALPTSAFRRHGPNAYTHLILLRKANQGGATTCLLQRRHAGRRLLASVLGAMLDDLRRLTVAQEAPSGAVVAVGQLRGRCWDAGFWVGRRQLTRAWDSTGASVDLGEFVELLTYGPIVTGSAAPHVPRGVPSIRQSGFTETGLRRLGLLRVEPGSAHDPPRSRVRRGDVLLPRSGSGSLGRNRVAAYDEDEPASIGCLVDLIRLRPGSLNPHYLWLFLRSRLGWGQIRSLINGVGIPNISFDEVRSLRIPTIPMAEQARYERRYREEVLPLHRMSTDCEATRLQAEVRFQDLVAHLDTRLGAARPGTGS